jgi:CheY-like chemotaxis protein
MIASRSRLFRSASFVTNTLRLLVCGGRVFLLGLPLPPLGVAAHGNGSEAAKSSHPRRRLGRRRRNQLFCSARRSPGSVVWVAQPVRTSSRPRHVCGTINDKRMLAAAHSSTRAKIDCCWFIQVKRRFGWSDVAPPGRFERPHTAPEAVALSPELRGRGPHEDTSFASTARHRSDHQNRLCGPMVASTLKHVVAHLGRVLVVDDSEIVRALIRVNLELEGFEVVTAVDGLDCLDKVVRVEPMLITLDVVMPRLDGFSTAIRLRGDQRTRHLPIVMITAAAQGRDLARGREIGVDAYITKPFEPGDLISTVRRLAVRPGLDTYAPEPTGRER